MKKEIFETKEQYLQFIQSWKDSCLIKEAKDAEHYALYAILRDKDPAKCFATPEQQSQKKLRCQGKTGYETYNNVMSLIKSGYIDDRLMKPFNGTLTKEHLNAMRELLKGAK